MKAPRPLSKARKVLLGKAAHLFATRGFHATSMRQLARATGKAPASFYSHYESKDDVLFALQADAFETLIQTARRAADEAEEPTARLYAFIFNHVRYVAENPDVMRVLVHDATALPRARRREIRALKDRYFEVGRSLVAARLPEEDRSAAEVERVTYAIFGMLNWLYGWYAPDRHGTPAEVAATLHRLAITGMSGRPPEAHVTSLAGRLTALAAPPLIGGQEVRS